MLTELAEGAGRRFRCRTLDTCGDLSCVAGSTDSRVQPPPGRRTSSEGASQCPDASHPATNRTLPWWTLHTREVGVTLGCSPIGPVQHRAANLSRDTLGASCRRRVFRCPAVLCTLSGRLPGRRTRRAGLSYRRAGASPRGGRAPRPAASAGPTRCGACRAAIGRAHVGRRVLLAASADRTVAREGDSPRAGRGPRECWWAHAEARGIRLVLVASSAMVVAEWAASSCSVSPVECAPALAARWGWTLARMPSAGESTVPVGHAR